MGDGFPFGKIRVFIGDKECLLPVQGRFDFVPRSYDDLNIGSFVLTATIRDFSRQLRKFLIREIGKKPKTTYRTIRKQCAKRNKSR